MASLAVFRKTLVLSLWLCIFILALQLHLFFLSSTSLLEQVDIAWRVLLHYLAISCILRTGFSFSNLPQPVHLEQYPHRNGKLSKDDSNDLEVTFLPAQDSVQTILHDGEDAVGRSDALQEAFAALSLLQNTYFDVVHGTWPTSIDWTGAVVETVVAGMLSTLTQALASGSPSRGGSRKQEENLISSLYAQIVDSYFGQRAVAIRFEAYDDMLWVVLGWIEAIKFVKLHVELHFPGTQHSCGHIPGTLDLALRKGSWHGFTWLCTFATRARAFWDFASEGWDTELCHGGMTWSPRLPPYKNAITNELWIAASISMHEHFPDDFLHRPFARSSEGLRDSDPVFVFAAAEGYAWFQDVNMTNLQGLNVDGYHIDGSKPDNTECDLRDEMVYTYNQGVILTGQRGLFAATGDALYLFEGHALIQDVISATGWDLGRRRPSDGTGTRRRGRLPPWRGLGRGGILEEQCDASGTCSQDGQAFKAIFFHHLTAFCAPLGSAGAAGGLHHGQRLAAAHAKACRAYSGWIKHNVDAALATRDSVGRFGMWWGAAAFGGKPVTPEEDGIDHEAANTTDYRNKGTPRDAVWGLSDGWEPGSHAVPAGSGVHPQPSGRDGTFPETSASPGMWVASDAGLSRPRRRLRDPNNRGRGRTVETQIGGIALLRAYYELSRMP